MARTSATGIDAWPRRVRGFTLVELLVILVIAGVVLALAAVNLAPSDAESARREAALLALDIERARDDAWFGGRPTAVAIADNHLRVLRLAEGREWKPVPGRDRPLPSGLQVASLAIDGERVNPREPLLFLPDGLGIPFRIGLAYRDEKPAITGDAGGSIRVEAR